MFNINIHCVIFGVNIKLNKKCILSSNKEDIEFPKLNLQPIHINDINNSIIKFLKQFIFINELELIPQIITINNNLLKSTTNIEDEINIVYGFIIDYKSSIDTNNVNWMDFDILKEHKYSTVIFETMQKLA